MTKAQSDVPRFWLDAFALLTAGFLLLTYAVSRGMTVDFDTSLLLSLRSDANPNDPVGSGVTEVAVRDITALAGLALLTLVTTLVCAYLLVKKQVALAVFCVVAVLGSALLTTVLKLLIDRDRPDLVSHGMAVYNQSFPSGHATQAAATYLFLAFLVGSQSASLIVKRLVLAAAIAVIAMVGASRVYLGVHWPSDVIAGWMVGSAWAMLIWYVTQKLVPLKNES